MTRGFIRAFLLAIVGLGVTFIGFFVVAIGIGFRRAVGDPVPFTDPRYAHLGSWQLVRLPAWLLPWDNAFDGLLGDTRGWYANWCAENGIAYPSFRAMWWWAAVRNPANYWSRVTTGVDVSRCVIDMVAGNDAEDTEEPGVFSWQLLCAHRDDGKVFPHFFLTWPWPFRQDKAVQLDVGWKISLSHNGMSSDASLKDRIKGSVFTPSLWKSL